MPPDMTDGFGKDSGARLIFESGPDMLLKELADAHTSIPYKRPSRIRRQRLRSLRDRDDGRCIHKESRPA